METVFLKEMRNVMMEMKIREMDAMKVKSRMDMYALMSVQLAMILVAMEYWTMENTVMMEITMTMMVALKLAN